jgi:hypothetical protein
MTRVGWSLLSGIGMGAAAVHALRVFPEAAAGKYTGGIFDVPVVGFSSIIGAGLGLGQLAALMVLPGLVERGPSSAQRAGLGVYWILASAIGIALTLIPLWGLKLSQLLGAPIALPALMLPGLAILGLLQALAIETLGVSLQKWVVRTILGGLLGALLTPVAYGIAVAVAPGSTLDVAGSGCIGLCVAWLQAGAFRRELEYESVAASSPT